MKSSRGQLKGPIEIRKATRPEIPGLSDVLLARFTDKQGELYRENVTSFGIPDDYAGRAFSNKTLLGLFDTGAAEFYVAWDGDKVAGFAQIAPRPRDTAELDRILVFPEYAGRGIGTQLLRRALSDLDRTTKVIARAAKEEARARRFYERHGFELLREEMVHTPWGSDVSLVIYQLMTRRY